MNSAKRQIYSSVLAVVFCGLFLLTGKLFVWQTPSAEDSKPDPAQTAASSENTVTTTTTTAAAVSDHTTTAVSQTDVTADSIDPPAPSDSTAPPADSTADTASTAPVSTSATEAVSTEAQNTSVLAEAAEGYFSDALFIGDSRTVGMAKYAKYEPFDSADFFATVGLATYKVADAENEVGDKKDLSFAQLLSSRQYGKVYIMLGINELGSEVEKIITHYQELIGTIRAAQPNAIIYIEANLHVAQSRSETDEIINNPNINNLNFALSQLADGQTIFYLNVNPLFDDENGALGEEYTHDGTHPLAKYYRQWAEWLAAHTAAG